MTDAASVYRTLTAGAAISAGGVTIWRSQLFLAGDSAAALFLCDADAEPGVRWARLEVRAYQLINDEWVALLSLGGGGGGARTVREGGSELQRQAKWMEFELPSASATALLFAYYRGEGRIASEEASLS